MVVVVVVVVAVVVVVVGCGGGLRFTLYASCFMVCGGDMTMMIVIMIMMIMVVVVVMVVPMLKEVVFVLEVEVVEVEVVITGMVAYRPHYQVVLIEQIRVRREGHDDETGQHNGQDAQVDKKLGVKKAARYRVPLKNERRDHDIADRRVENRVVVTCLTRG